MQVGRLSFKVIALCLILASFLLFAISTVQAQTKLLCLHSGDKIQFSKFLKRGKAQQCKILKFDGRMYGSQWSSQGEGGKLPHFETQTNLHRTKKSLHLRQQ